MAAPAEVIVWKALLHIHLFLFKFCDVLSLLHLWRVSTSSYTSQGWETLRKPRGKDILWEFSSNCFYRRDKDKQANKLRPQEQCSAGWQWSRLNFSASVDVSELWGFPNWQLFSGGFSDTVFTRHEQVGELQQTAPNTALSIISHSIHENRSTAGDYSTSDQTIKRNAAKKKKREDSELI